jgi:hypothetical protein
MGIRLTLKKWFMIYLTRVMMMLILRRATLIAMGRILLVMIDL